MLKNRKKLIGSNPIRKEGLAKVNGSALYIDDLTMPELLHGVTVRSKVARAKIKSIEYLPGIPWEEFTIVTAKDIPAKNAVTLLIEDQPYLADGMINHPEEAIVLLAHPDRHLAIKARDYVKVNVEELPACFTIDDAIACKPLVWGNNNVFKEFTIEKGEVVSVWSRAAHLIEDTYETGAQEQLYIENNGMIAVANERDGVTVWGSLQCPYYVQKAMKSLFDLPAEKLRVIQVETGGGFGGKEEYPSMIAGHAALLAWKSGKPVKLIYDRMEDMAATTKRHPSKTKIKMAVDREGKILALDIDFILDGGAYCTLSPVVLSRGGIHAAGPYFIENVRVRARAVATNTPPQGAFRGFGAPQSIFAMERHMDRAAAKIGMSPADFRKINLIRDGQTSATGQLIQENVDMRAMLDRALKVSNYDKKVEQFSRDNPGSHIKKGMGFATFFHGAGFTGSGERFLASIVGVEANRDGKVCVLASSTEIGQGKNTVLSQIAAEALGISYEMVDVLNPDTARVPNSGPTVASRTVMIVGKLVESACLGMKQVLQQAGMLPEKYSDKEWTKACQKYWDKFGTLKSYSQYKQPPHINWDEVKYKGDAYATYAWAVYLAEVTIDTTTFETKVDNFWALQDVGRVVHPMLAEGQIEGGVAQGVGYALYEKIVWKNGRMANNTMTNYIMPTSVDVPNIKVIFEEHPQPYGPGGAKGIGELPLDGAAPAVLNAVQNALGATVRTNSIPMTPEDLMKNMQAAGALK